MINAARNGSDLNEPEDDPVPDRRKSYPAHQDQVRARCRVRKTRIKPMVSPKATQDRFV